MNRISRHQLFMEIAHVVAKRSTCMRLNVGAVMTYDSSIVAIGYNGAASGEPHCQGEHCSGWGGGCKRAIHAEMNALARVPDMLHGLDLYITHSPCSVCWDKLAEDRRVYRIFFGTPFRETSHLVDSLFGDMIVYRVLPAGGIIDWSTGRLLSAQEV